jgi:hypothetical protein
MKHMFSNASASSISKLPEPFKTAIQNSRLWKWERTQNMPTTGCWASLSLLEFSGGTADLRQHWFAPEYTVHSNADLYASILGITRKRALRASDLEEVCNALSQSPVFSAKTVDVSTLQDWSIQVMKFLPIGFLKEYLV